MDYTHMQEHTHSQSHIKTLKTQTHTNSGKDCSQRQAHTLMQIHTFDKKGADENNFGLLSGPILYIFFKMLCNHTDTEKVSLNH